MRRDERVYPTKRGEDVCSGHGARDLSRCPSHPIPRVRADSGRE